MEMPLVIIPETPNMSMLSNISHSSCNLSDIDQKIQCDMLDNNKSDDTRITLIKVLVNEMKCTISTMGDEIDYLKKDARQKNETINFLIAHNNLPTSQQLQSMKNNISDLLCERTHIHELLSFFTKQLNGRQSSESSEHSYQNEDPESMDSNSSAYLDKIYWENGIKNGCLKNITLRRRKARKPSTQEDDYMEDHEEFAARLAKLRKYDSENSTLEEDLDSASVQEKCDLVTPDELQDEMSFRILNELIVKFGMQIHHANLIQKTTDERRSFEDDTDFDASNNSDTTDGRDGDDELLFNSRLNKTKKIKKKERVPDIPNINPTYIDRGLCTITSIKDVTPGDISDGENRHRDFGAWEKSSSGFGSKMLKKYGYCGKGLGKMENGIVNPITIESKKRFSKDSLHSTIIRKNNYVHPWPKGTTLITGSSILLGIQEGKLKRYNAKVRAFSGATVDDMHDYLKPLLKKKPDNIILHIGTNDSVGKSADDIMAEIFNLVEFIEYELPMVNLCISCPVMRIDNMKANKVLRDLCSLLKIHFRSSNVIFHDKFNGTCLGHKGLHLNAKGSSLLAANYISYMRCL